MVIELKSLTTGYKRGKTVEISKGLNVGLQAGTFACLIGPNGAGKSTLLRTLCGFEHPLSGEVNLMGHSVADTSAEELARLVSVVLPDRGSMGMVTTTELIGLGRSPYSGFWGGLSDHDRKIVDKAMELTGTVHLKERIVDTLSDGERQRVFIAKALAQDTPLLLLDEASAFLDYPSKFRLFRLMREITRKENKAVLFSTHDLEMALRMADILWVLDGSHHIHTGTPEELAENGVLSMVFARDGLSFNPSSMTFEISC